MSSAELTAGAAENLSAPAPTRSTTMSTPEEIPECPICMSAPRDPITVDCGGNHRFCRTCAETWRARSTSCAVCRQPVHNVAAPPQAGRLVHWVPDDYLTMQLARILEDLELPPEALRVAADRMAEHQRGGND